jgi:hypothetical protein
MLDFKRLHEDWWNGLSQEERDHIQQRKKLEEENTFYVTTTLLDDDYRMVKYGGKRKEVSQDVKLHRPIYEGNQVSDKILLSFGGYRQYHFDQDFIAHVLPRMKQEPDSRFSIDMGHEVYVKHDEMIRIIEESIKSLQNRSVVV